MQLAQQIAVFGSGSYFLVGLLTGTWKYWHMSRSDKASTPRYIDISHKASLQYSFACLVLLQFSQLSQWPPLVNSIAVGISVFFFGAAIFSYLVHGFLQDTTNQFRKPHKLGKTTLSPWLLGGAMILLVIGEVGSFAVLFSGALL